MISPETCQTFIAELAKTTDQAFLVKRLAEFVEKEPHLCAFVSVALGNIGAFSNPVSTALIALAIYEKMRVSQEKADELRRTIGGEAQKERERPS